MTQPPPVDVFISHSSEDNAFVDRLVADLEAEGISTWYDKNNLAVGESIVGSINQAMGSCRYLLAVLSPRSISSRWVQEELNAAVMMQLAYDGTFVIPAVIEDCELPPLLAHRRYADFAASYEAALADVVQAIKADEVVRERLEAPRIYPADGDPGGVFDPHLIVKSTRFDRCFKITCDLEKTVSVFLGVARSALGLSFGHIDIASGLRWSYRYALLVDGTAVDLTARLGDVAKTGDVVQLRIQATYEDMFEKELQEMRDVIFMLTPDVVARQRYLEAQVGSRTRTAGSNLRLSANTGFAHVDNPASPAPTS